MSVAIGIFVVIVMLITLAAAAFTNVKVWGLVRESVASIAKLPPEQRRGVLLRLAATYALALGLVAVVLIAPFGVRRTLTYFVILPVLVVVPLAVIAAGIRGYRGQRRRRPPEG